MSMDDIDDHIYTKEIRLDKHLDKKTRLRCSYCKHPTNHRVLRSVEDVWGSDFGLAGHQLHMIVQCMGCDVISYCKESGDNETYVEKNDSDGESTLEYKITTDQYPIVNVTFANPKHYSSMPKEVTSTYHDTYKALTHGLDQLAGIGMRQTVERVCVQNDITSGNLWQKINNLHEKGIVTEQMKDLLHNVRIFGNNNAHTDSAPSIYELTEAWSALDNFLSSVYGTSDSIQHFNFLRSSK